MKQLHSQGSQEDRSAIAFPLLTVMLAMLVAVAPMAVDMYLPAMQLMAKDLQAPIHQVELSVSTFLLGFAGGQLFGGPLSDRFGRKPIVALGLIIFICSSLALTMVSSLDGLLVLRAVQAVGGGIAIVNSSAMVRDLFSGPDVARVLSTVALVMMTAPLVSPMLGSLVVATLGWRAIFAILAGYAVFVLLLFMSKVPESRRLIPAAKRTGIFTTYRRVLTHRQGMGYVMAVSCTFGGMFAFITASPFIYLEFFRVSTGMFPFLFGVNVLLIMVLNRLNIRLLEKYHPRQILLAGLTLQLLCGIGLVIAGTLQASLPVIVLLNMGFVGSLGLIGANATACCLNYFPDISGSANAVIGVTEFTVGALAGVLWAVLHGAVFADHRLLPMAVVMAGCSVLGVLSVLMLTRREALSAHLHTDSTQGEASEYREAS